jgi:phosphoglycerate dehydrogenase-like enzyme
MKVVYLLRHAGISSRTPEGWHSAVIAASDGSYDEEDLREVEDADVLVVGLEPVDETLLARAPGLGLIQRLGRGYCNIDVEAASRRGIPVCGMPDFNAATVAEHTMMLMLALLRRVFDSTLLMKAGRWPVADVVGHGIFDLAGKTVGIVGYGAIGRAVARRVLAFEADVCVHDPDPNGIETELETLPLNALLRRSDVVTLHVPLTPESRGMIGRPELGLMRRTALFVNTARGALVDEVALAEALVNKSIAGAGIDVFAEEPLDPAHPLRRCPNLLLTPHTAGQTREAMERMVGLMLDNLLRFERGEAPRCLLNDSARA